MENEIKEINQEKVEKIKEELKNNLQEEVVKEAVMDNKFEFEFFGVKYKIRKPTLKEKQEMIQKKTEKYIELLKDPKKETEESLKKLYKSRGVNIDGMIEEFNGLEKQKKNLMDKLGKAIKEKQPEKDLEILKNEIEKITEKQRDLSVKKTMYLENTIESEIINYAGLYLVFLILEKWENEKWNRAFCKWEDFENQDDEFVNTIVMYYILMNNSSIE